MKNKRRIVIVNELIVLFLISFPTRLIMIFYGISENLMKIVKLNIENRIKCSGNINCNRYYTFF
jgi:hypothetical protein